MFYHESKEPMENRQALTAAERQLLQFLETRARTDVEPPTLDQVCAELGRKSRGSLHKLVTALTQAGFVEPTQGQRRGIRLSSPPAVETNFYSVPLLGRIAAGRPIEAVVDAQPIAVSQEMFAQRPDYALQVRGDSMVDAGILDGDTVLIGRTDRARNGQIVVALIDGEAATLKRLEARAGSVWLHPENPAYQSQQYRADQVDIQGVLMGLLRRY